MFSFSYSLPKIKPSFWPLHLIFILQEEQECFLPFSFSSMNVLRSCVSHLWQSNALHLELFFIIDSIICVDAELTLNVPLVSGVQHRDSTGLHTMLRSPPAEPPPVSTEHCCGAWPLLYRDDESHQLGLPLCFAKAIKSVSLYHTLLINLWPMIKVSSSKNTGKIWRW